jgi:hypothetical protein
MVPPPIEYFAGSRKTARTLVVQCFWIWSNSDEGRTSAYGGAAERKSAD